MSHEVFYTWLPVFPGFYESVLYNSDMEYYLERELYLDCQEVIPRELMEYWLRNRKTGSKSGLAVRYEDYEKDAAVAFCDRVEGTLREVLDDEEITVTYEGIQRPREYNFRTDTVHCTISFDPERALEYCRAHAESFQKYLLCNYKSRDGFISFHPYEVSEWLKLENWDAHKPGAVLDFIIRDYLDYDDASYILSEGVREEVDFSSYCDYSPADAEFLESEEALEIGREFSRLMDQGRAYIEAMGNSKRSRELIEDAVEKLKKNYVKKDGRRYSRLVIRSAGCYISSGGLLSEKKAWRKNEFRKKKKSMGLPLVLAGGSDRDGGCARCAGCICRDPVYPAIYFIPRNDPGNIH